ncbi:MAG TPA: hypothetical protein VNA65_02540 [Candidatus Dormibacteraeota bacterium]|nr:hypothetical protein [Candidatus Dormibacteraeota bacterium]
MQNRREISTGFLERLADPGYRLNGENPSTATVDRAKHWAEVYDQLLAFKRELLDLCQRYAEHAEPEVARAIRETDMIMLEVQVSRFRQKRDYWTIRAAELSGNGRHGGPD